MLARSQAVAWPKIWITLATLSAPCHPPAFWVSAPKFRMVALVLLLLVILIVLWPVLTTRVPAYPLVPSVVLALVLPMTFRTACPLPWGVDWNR